MAVVPATAIGEAPRDKATGGGQILLTSSDPGKGALDTLAFTAQRERGATDESGLADGQVQVNRRTGTAAQDIKFHGVVECLIVVGNKAYINGVDKRRGTEFELYIVDGGEGGSNSSDQAMLWYGPEETDDNEPDQQVIGNFTPPEENEHCGIEEDPKNERNLARGNYQVHDANPAAPSGGSAPVLPLP